MKQNLQIFHVLTSHLQLLSHVDQRDQ